MVVITSPVTPPVQPSFAQVQADHANFARLAFVVGDRSGLFGLIFAASHSTSAQQCGVVPHLGDRQNRALVFDGAHME
ncbi:hypothetical protein [Candidatus Amarolinea dominans]|uniref:hypothetical protein n=1 Tax=Candidatus Amarolinea dominans TaxID=3140696 RepID=UPI0031355106|nr:hypothetical protein [Anaerolineae bacterium]